MLIGQSRHNTSHYWLLKFVGIDECIREFTGPSIATICEERNMVLKHFSLFTVVLFYLILINLSFTEILDLSVMIISKYFMVIILNYLRHYIGVYMINMKSHIGEIIYRNSLFIQILIGDFVSHVI